MSKIIPGMTATFTIDAVDLDRMDPAYKAQDGKTVLVLGRYARGGFEVESMDGQWQGVAKPSELTPLDDGTSRIWTVPFYNKTGAGAALVFAPTGKIAARLLASLLKEIGGGGKYDIDESDIVAQEPVPMSAMIITMPES